MPFLKWLVLVLIFFFWGGTRTVFAECNVTADSYYLNSNSNVNINVSLKNTGETVISWIKIPVSSSNLINISPVIQDSGWVLNDSEGNYVYSFGDIYPNEIINFSVSATTLETGIVNWNWETSENFYGEPVVSCDALQFSITNNNPNPTPIPLPVITNLVASVGSVNTTLTWNTDVNSYGAIAYGQNTSYGSRSEETTATTNHSLTLSSLLPSTTYHFVVESRNDNGTTTSSDATFTTAAAGVVQTVTSTVAISTTTTTTTTNLVTKILKDTTPPTITIKTDFDKNFETAPTVIGKVVDGGEVNQGVASIDYSTDGGKNWLPVDNIDNLGKKSTDFEFTPPKLDDGNYPIKIRAKDISGNVGMSKVLTMVIDRLPPQIGGGLFLLGPMILKPDTKGNIYTIAGLETKVVLGAIGGPTGIDLWVNLEKFSLIKNNESGLWSGIIKNDKSGTAEMKAKSIDGAKNETERNLSTMIFLPAGKVIDENIKTISKAKVKVYMFEKTLNDFTLWEAEPYLQTNPMETDENGEYRLVLPSGKFFVEVEAKGKRKIRSEIFELETATPINQNFILEKSVFWGNWWPKTISIQIENFNVQSDKKNSLVGKLMPDFDLSYEDGQFNNTLILGKPAIVTFISTWEPQTSDQLKILEQLKAENSGINVVAVAVQESISKIDIFKKNGKYEVPIIADSDGILVKPLGLESLPTHIFLDRKGIIKETNVGLLDKNNLLEKILN